MNDKAQQAIQTLLESLDLAQHPEVAGTPERVAEMWRSNLLSGYEKDVADVLRERIPDSSGSVLTVRKIPFHGVCPHHLVPFFGDVSIAYDPEEEIVGLGALERLVATLSRRLILQEQLTGQLVDALMDELNAKGAACRISAQHLCFMLRGREPRGTEIVTHAFRGSLEGAYALFNDPAGETQKK